MKPLVIAYAVTLTAATALATGGTLAAEGLCADIYENAPVQRHQSCVDKRRNQYGHECRATDPGCVEGCNASSVKFKEGTGQGRFEDGVLGLGLGWEPGQRGQFSEYYQLTVYGPDGAILLRRYPNREQVHTFQGCGLADLPPGTEYTADIVAFNFDGSRPEDSIRFTTREHCVSDDLYFPRPGGRTGWSHHVQQGLFRLNLSGVTYADCLRPPECLRAYVCRTRAALHEAVHTQSASVNAAHFADIGCVTEGVNHLNGYVAEFNNLQGPVLAIGNHNFHYGVTSTRSRRVNGVFQCTHESDHGGLFYTGEHFHYWPMPVDSPPYTPPTPPAEPEPEPDPQPEPQPVDTGGSCTPGAPIVSGR